MYGLMVRDVMKGFVYRAALAVCVVSLAAGCGRRDAVGEAFSVGDFFEDGAAGIKPAGVTRRPADGGGDDVTLFWPSHARASSVSLSASCRCRASTGPYATTP